MLKFLKNLFAMSPDERLENALIDMEHAKSMMNFARTNPRFMPYYAAKYNKAQNAYFHALQAMQTTARG